MSIIINHEELRIRPSSIDSFYGCSYQWGKTYLEGTRSIPNSRAAIGTAIHAGVETLWNDAIKTGKKDGNLSKLTDAAFEAWKEESQKGMQYGDGEDEGTCTAEIIKGTEAYVEDIMPFAQIPVAVEQFYKIDIDHQVVKELGGTIDYITHNTIADTKTGKRKPSVANYTTQQSTYKILALANGIDVKYNQIHSVVLKKAPEGSIIGMNEVINIDRTKYLINSMLDTLDLVMKDAAPIETVLRGNPNYMFCSNKFCAHYQSCPFVKGEAKAIQL